MGDTALMDAVDAAVPAERAQAGARTPSRVLIDLSLQLSGGRQVHRETPLPTAAFRASVFSCRQVSASTFEMLRG